MDKNPLQNQNKDIKTENSAKMEEVVENTAPMGESEPKTEEEKSRQNVYNKDFYNNRYYSPVYIPTPTVSPEALEKRRVKSVANRVGFGLLLYNFILFFVQLILVTVLAGIGRADLLEDSFFQLELNLVLTALAFLPSAAVIIKLNKSRSEISFSLPEGKNFIPLLLMGAGFMYVANIVVILFQNNFSSLGEIKGGEIDLPSGFLGFLISVLTVAVAPALFEEFLIRGAVMGSLLRFSKPFAIFTSAVIFGLIHGNLVQIPFAFLAGIVIGLAVVETKSIWTGVLIHFLNNFISICFDYLQRSLGEELTNYFYMFFILIMIFVGFLGFYLYCHNNKSAFEFEKMDFAVSSVKHFKWTMGSLAMVIYIILIATEIIFVQVMG